MEQKNSRVSEDNSIFKLATEIMEEDGPADIVFGPDVVVDASSPMPYPPYTAAYAHMLERGEIQINGRTLTHDDMDMSAAELWPDATAEELPAVIRQHLAQTGLMEAVHEFYQAD